MLMDSVDTINDLRSYTCWADAVSVRGYWIAGDGGGGVFYRDPVSADLEDGGMVIQPAPQLPGRWKRLLETYVNVKWFGAKGDYGPLTDDTLPIQNAIDYLRRLMLNLDDGVTVKGGKLACSLTLYLPRGKYRVTSTLMLGEYLGVKGDYDAMLVCDDPMVPILQIGSYYNNVQGLGFAGGLHHIVIPRPSAPSRGSPGMGEIVIRDCTFRYPAGPCIYQDPHFTGHPGPLVANLLVEDCEFQGACFFWGSFQPAIFQGCNLNVDLASPPRDDGGKPLAVWNSCGILHVSDVRGDPSNYTRDHDGGWFQGTRFCHFTRVRFGGGNRLTGFRIRTSMTYKGMRLPIGTIGKNTLACIYISESGMYSFGEHNWMEIYEEFPAVIDVRSLIPSDLPEPYNWVTMVGTWGVWVDASVSLPVLVARQKSSTIIHLEGFQGAVLEGYPSSGFRFRQSSDPTTKEGVDLWPYLRQFMDSEPSPYANTLYPASDMHQNNLYFPGMFDLSQGMISPDIVGVVKGQPDSSTGYTLSTYVSLQDGAWVWIDMGTAAGWGAGLPAGEYVLSMYIKTNWAGEVLLGRFDQNTPGAFPQFLAVRRLVQAAYYQRVWFSFYHDGSEKLFSLQINDWPKGGTLSVGLFAVHKGTTPAPYTFPVDNFVTPTANITMEDYVQESYRAMESPKAGTYKQGDIVYNANPQPGGYVGWICVQGTGANTPAEWKAFGAISL